jgi:hypothetical protein
VAYRIRLPSQLAAVRDVFHISQLKKCMKMPTEIVGSQTIDIEPDLSYTEQPIQILDTKERVTRRKKIQMYNVAEPPELFRLKCANDYHTIAISLTHFKRNNPLVCRVFARYNHGSTGSKQVHLARRRVHITE